MTVAELIAKLQKMPPDAMAVIRASHWGQSSELYEVDDVSVDGSLVQIHEGSEAL